jgi:hypothetical protein
MIDTVEENQSLRHDQGGWIVVIASNSPDGQRTVAWRIHAGKTQLGPRHGRFVTVLPPFIPCRS